MKRVFVVIREFSYENDDKSYKTTDIYPEVFTTIKNANNFIDHYTKRSETVSEEKDCCRFAFRKTVRTESDTYIRWTILGRNMNAIY